MAGHSKWAQIKRKKAVVDAKRGQVFTKIIKEITVAARLGGGDEDANPRLRQAVLSAKAANMPADNVKRAVQKGTGELPGISYEDAMFEGYGPGGVAIMVEVTTDNRKRTVAELRHLITKHGGNLGETGCVAWMFNKKGLITVEKNGVNNESLLDSILTGGGDDFSDEDDVYVVESTPDQMISVREQLEADGFSVISSEIMLTPQNSMSVEGETAKRVIQLLEALDDHDDVQKVSANFDFDDAEIEKVSCMRRIIGVDPGISTTGYGVIESDGDAISIITWGAISPPPKKTIHVRLGVLYDGIKDIIDRYNPTEFAIEEAFYRNNVKTVLVLGQARGVVMLAAAHQGLPCYEYSPRKIKMSVVGNGNASKEQVQYMVASILEMEKTPKKHDVTDALATALCHLHQPEAIAA